MPRPLKIKKVVGTMKQTLINYIALLPPSPAQSKQVKNSSFQLSLGWSWTEHSMFQSLQLLHTGLASVSPVWGLLRIKMVVLPNTNLEDLQKLWLTWFLNAIFCMIPFCQDKEAAVFFWHGDTDIVKKIKKFGNDPSKETKLNYKLTLMRWSCMSYVAEN